MAKMLYYFKTWYKIFSFLDWQNYMHENEIPQLFTLSHFLR